MCVVRRHPAWLDAAARHQVGWGPIGIKDKRRAFASPAFDALARWRSDKRDRTVVCKGHIRPRPAIDGVGVPPGVGEVTLMEQRVPAPAMISVQMRVLRVTTNSAVGVVAPQGHGVWPLPAVL